MNMAPIPIEPPPCAYRFPSAKSGQGPHGVVCLGGDFSPGTILDAYRHGLFPWPISEDTVPWCSPDPRCVYSLTEPDRISRSLRRGIRAGGFRISVNEAFAGVMHACADRERDTWILPGYVRGMRELRALGWAHSLEVWDAASGELIGGIYGLAVGTMFAGESMFHSRTDASKIAFFALMKLLRANGFQLVDVQVESDHLLSLGCVTMPRATFLRRLEALLRTRASFPKDVPSDLFAGV